MRAKWLLSAVAVVCWVMTAQAQNKADKESVAYEVVSKIREFVERDFYKSVEFPSFAERHPTNADIDKALADLHASHTRRFMPGTIDYYEVADVYGRRLGINRRFVFPPYGEVKYEGIGIASAIIDGKRFVTDVYDGAIAQTAGILVGDEILAVDGRPFDEIQSFKGLAGKVVVVTIRRSAKARPLDMPVMVTSISPVRMFLEAINASARIIESRSRSIGYIRLWTLASSLTNETVESLMREGILSDAAGLILDLRGRWGGISSELPAILTDDFSDISFSAQGWSRSQREAWRKPIVVLIDEGTRSANELLACAMKRRGFTLIGKKSAGAVLGGHAYLLPDNSLLMLATAAVRIGGEELEGKGVTPDKIVDAPVPYAMGADPQLDVALEEMVAQLPNASPWGSSSSLRDSRCAMENAIQ